jgi:hypothetical protein
MKLGIMQGRLSLPVDEHIQEFPFDKWKMEFIHLFNMKLNHIEWLVTKLSYKENPIFSNNYQLSNLPINSICADNLVDEKIHNLKFLKKELLPLCDAAYKNNIPSITIPLLEESSLVDNKKRKTFCKNILKITEMLKNPISFTFEAELGIEELKEIVDLSDNFFVTYDTGNITSFGIDHKEYIKSLGKKINNVHLKDRTKNAETVTPGKGDTDFKTIFQCLKKINYNSTFTMQTARGPFGEEINTILDHKNYFKEIFDE